MHLHDKNADVWKNENMVKHIILIFSRKQETMKTDMLIPQTTVGQWSMME